jgi:PAS domain S-box-containing protein
MFGIPVKPELLIGSDCSDSAEQSKHLFEDQDKFVSDIERILREKKYILNDELQLADGRYFERDYIPTYVDNTYSGHLWKYRDITERKLAEKSLQESDDRFSQVVAQSQEVVWEVDAQGLYTYVSPMAKDVYGYAPDELIGKLHFYDLCPIEERSMLTQAAFEIFGKKEDIHNLVNKVLKPDFTEVILLTNGIPMLNEQGELIGYRGIDADITEQKRAEMELTKFRTISDQANYGAFISSLEGNIQYVNPCLAQMLGWEAEELIGKHITVLQSEDHLHRLQEIGNLIRNQGGFVSEELHYKRKDGQTFPTLMTAKVIFNENQEAQYVSSTLIDITERKLNEENLLRLTRLRSLTSNINQAIVTEKTKDKLLEKVCSIAIVSGKFQMTWIGLVDELTMSVKPYLIDGFEDGYLSQIKPISVQDNQEGRGPTGTALREGRPFICNDIANDPNMIIWRDEALKRNYRSAIAIPIKQFDEIYGVLNLYSTQPNFFNEDEVQLLVEVVDNIGNALEAIETEAERKLAEAELRKLSQVVEQSPVSIVITNLDGNIEYANPKARETTGYLYEELIGTNPRVLQSGETSKDEYTTLWETISVGKEWRGLFHNKKKTGELYWESSTISPILDENGSILNYVAIKEDITQKKQAEEDLMKFRTVSDMATYGTAINGVNGEFQYVNKSWAEMHGYEVEELIGKNLRIGHNEEQLKEVDGLIGDLFRTGEMKPTEVWHVRRDGSVFPTLMSANVIYDANHNPLFLSATCIDITDLKKSEEALILSESALNYAQSIANMGSWEVDYLSGKTIWSKNLFQLYEIDTYMDEIPMEYFHDMVHPDDLPLFESSLKVITEFRQSLTFDIRLILPNGKQKWIQNNVVPVVENDVLIGLRGVNMDVTDKKQKDDQLKIQNERLNAIVQAMPDLIFAIDTHGTYLEYFASDTAKGSLIKTTDIVGSNLKDLFDEKTAISHLNHINECVKEQKLVTYEYTLPQGEETLYFEARTVPLGTDKVLAFVRDITAGKHAEIEIKKLSQAVEQSPILVVISDLDGHIEYVNPAFTNVTGYSSEEVIGKKTSILKSGKTDISTYTDLWNTISLGMEWHNEWINKKKDGELYWESVSITPIHDESGNIINYLAVKQDITERKKAEQEIRELNENLELKIQQRTEQLAKTNNDLLQSIEERKRLDEALIASEQSYQTVVENVNEVIFQTDAEGLWLFLNKAWTEVTGFSVDESLGQLFLNYVHPDDRQRNMELFAPLINREKDHCRHEVRYLTKDGGYRWIEVFARLGLNEKDEITGTYGTLQDITERKRAEDFENEMLQLSPQLTGITANEIKSALNLALSRIGKFLNADRAYIFEFTGGKDIMSNTYEWCNADINPEIDNLQNIPCEMLPMWMDELNKHRNIIIPSIVDLPWNWQAEKEILEPQGIQSLIAIPMLIEDQLIGFVGLDSVLVKRDYSIAEINILKVWSSMLASLINNYRTEGLLEQTRQNFETFFNTIDDFLWVLDDTGNIIHINNTVINRLGYTPEELESTSILKVHPTDRRDEAERVVGEMLQGVTEFCPVPVVTKNGQQIPVETRVKHGNWNGQPAIFGVSKDISKIQLSEQKFSTAFQSNSALMAISIFDGGQYLDVNNTFLKVLDYSREEVIGRTNAELDFFPDKTLRAQIVKSIEENGPVRELEAVIRRKDGELRTIILSADTIYLGETKCLLTVSVDITERKLAEEEIRKARMEAEKANVAKSEFLSRMSHELRTPMNSILGFAQLLEMGQMNPSQKKGVNHIMRSGKHLLSLINEVLDISRIEAGRLSISIEPIKIDSILEEMIDVLKPMTEDNEVNIRIVPSEDNKLFVNFDRQSMKQVMLNLLNNAVKYNRPGGSVTISTQLLPKTADGKSFVRISIADTGLGISTEDLPKLFTPFERIGASKTAIEGTGLGLAVVKKLIDAMGGLLGVTSTLGEGTTFWIDLPKAESQLETLHQLDNLTGEHSEQVEKRGTILYIEDNTSNIELVEQILLMQRPEIQLISNSHGKYAVKLASEYKPDLILLDLNLPDIHGSEVLKRLLKNEKTKNIPVVVISADAMHKQVENLLNAGARTYLTKPLEVVSFLKVIDEYIFE